MQSVILVIYLMIVAALVGIVLLQRSEGGGLGIGGGGNFLSSRGTANLLTRTTAILGGLFFAISLLLSILAGIERRPNTILQTPSPTSQPGAPIAPPAGNTNILDQLKPTQPAAPAPPQSR